MFLYSVILVLYEGLFHEIFLIWTPSDSQLISGIGNKLNSNLKLHFRVQFAVNFGSGAYQCSVVFFFK